MGPSRFRRNKSVHTREKQSQILGIEHCGKKGKSSMVKFSDVTIRYGSDVILSNLSFKVSQGTHMALLGASGCGKTSILRTIIEKRREEHKLSTPPTVDYDGYVYVEKNVTIGYVPQEPSLAPWTIVKRNIALGISMTNARTGVRLNSWIAEIIDKLELGAYMYHFPSQLSVGTSKRVSLARALVLRPVILLLDEPFAGFDFDIRERAIAFLRRYCEEIHATMILVSHEPYEAACLCDEVSIVVDPTQGRLVHIDIESDGRDKFRDRIFAESKKYLGKLKGGPRV